MNKILSFLMIPSIVVSSLLIFNDPAEAGRKGIPGRRRGAGTRLVDKDTILRSQQLNYVITDYGVFTLS